MVKKKIESLIIENTLERWIVFHEFGHLFTNVIFKKINQQYAVLKSVEFYLVNNQPQAGIQSTPLHDLFVLCDRYKKLDYNYVMSKNDNDLFYPVILGFASGSIFDDVFSKKGDFLTMLWSPKLMPNRDRDIISCLRRLANRDIHELELILSGYKEIIAKHKTALSSLINDLCLFDIPVKDNLSYISDDLLNEVIEFIESKLPDTLLYDVKCLTKTFPIK